MRNVNSLLPFPAIGFPSVSVTLNSLHSVAFIIGLLQIFKDVFAESKTCGARETAVAR
jgi:hypothetical protein